MNRLLALLAVVALAGCGSDVTDLISGSCTSAGPAKAQINPNPTCMLAPGNATINITLCAECLASSAGCIPEFQMDGSLELAPNVCQADSSANCTSTGAGCNAAVPRATCTVVIPAATGTRTMTIVGGDNQLITGQLVISATGSSVCNL